jgi:RecA-family ATPase
VTPAEQRLRFLSHCRVGPGYLGWATNDGVYQQRRFENDRDALNLIDQHIDSHNIYCSMASFPSGAKRSASNAALLKAFWLDVDAHGGKYVRPEAAAMAVKAFVEAAKLPLPNYVHATGHGLHVLWVLSEPVRRDQWHPVADALQELAKIHDLGADPITADAARILRIPGTYNFRDPDDPRETNLVVIRRGETELWELQGAIAGALATTQHAQPAPKPTNIPDRFPDTPENVEIVRAMLTFIDPDRGTNGTRVKWRNVVWAVAATGLEAAYSLARDWSEAGDLWDGAKFDQVWNSYDPARNEGITFGTLVHHARAAGYAGFLPGEAKQFASLPWKRTMPAQARTVSGLVTQRVSDIEPEPIDWLVEDAIPLGMLVVIGGQPGLGKSQIAIKLAAGVTTGIGLPDDSNFDRLGSVIILANEDDAARTIRPRLDAAGADISKVHIVEGVAREGAKVGLFQLDTDTAALCQLAEEIGDVRLIIIDPPTAYLGSKVDAYKESDVRGLLTPLGQLANDTGALVLLIVHLNKRTDGGVQQRFGGSTAWIAAPRAAFLVAQEDGSDRRYMLPVKNNLGNDRKGFEYGIAEKLLTYTNEIIKAPHIEWLATTNRSASDLLNPPKPKPPSAVDEAKSFLQHELGSGPKLSSEIEQAAKSVGISTMSLRRAKAALAVNTYKDRSVWRCALLRSEEDEQVERPR